MRTVKFESRNFQNQSKDGKTSTTSINYQLVFMNEILVDVRNEHGYSVEPNSECWSYFSQKYAI